MDMELRQLRQALSRLRVEWESEKDQRGKAEASVSKLTQTNDVCSKRSTRPFDCVLLTGVVWCKPVVQELKLSAKTLQVEFQRLSMEMEGQCFAMAMHSSDPK